MSSPFRPLPTQQIIDALGTLPAFRFEGVSGEDAVHFALARAIASGQDAQALASDLTANAVWMGLDLSQLQETTTASPAGIGAPRALPVAPVWAQSAAERAALTKTPIRIAVLDRDPALLPELRMPAAFRGQAATATLGPIAVSMPGQTVTVQKWIKIFPLPQTVSFQSGSTVLFVAQVAGSGSMKTVSMASGSVWIDIAPFASGAPANSYAGIAVEGGTIDCDQNLSIGGATVNVPAGAKLRLTVTPAPGSGGGSTVASVAPPASIEFLFPASGSPSASVKSFTAEIYGQTFACEPGNTPPVYVAEWGSLVIPCKSDQTSFHPSAALGTSLFSLDGSASHEGTGWALPAAVGTPSTLGNAAVAGYFLLAFATGQPGAGLFANWPGLAQPEPQSSGMLIANSATLILLSHSGLPQAILSKQVLPLWTDQDAPLRDCSLTAVRTTNATLIYENASGHEILELGCAMEGDLDRPLEATGTRFPIAIPEALLAFSQTLTTLRILAFAFFTPAERDAIEKKYPNGFPLALDNALINVSVPLLLIAEVRYSLSNPDALEAESAALILGFQYKMEFPFLPDPYTGPQPYTSDDPWPVGGLLAGVALLPGGVVETRLIDLGHPHSATPPADEASSGVIESAAAAQKKIASGTFQLGSADAAVQVPTSIAPPFTLNIGAPPGALVPASAQNPAQAIAPQAEQNPNPQPLPPPAFGLPMLDVSTRASLFGVEIIDFEPRTANLVLTIDGLSARTIALFAPLISLPSISWEPMYNLSNQPGPVDKLLNPPNDGPLCGLAVNSIELVPVAPLPSLSAILTVEQTVPTYPAFGGVLTLPFGMIAAPVQVVGKDGGPAPTLTQPHFELDGTAGKVKLTGAHQLTLRPPMPNTPAPQFTGATFLRWEDDNPGFPGLSYGEQVLGRSVASIFSSRFETKPSRGVPVRRYDWTGYGASLFSDWYNYEAHPTDVVQADFKTSIGRTGHEVIQVQSVIYPWGVKVVRTITIDRQNSGSVERTDSGWIAASDGDLSFPSSNTTDDIQPGDVHKGAIFGLLQVKNIREFGLPLTTSASNDAAPPPAPPGPPTPSPVTMQPVTFDADVAIIADHPILQGSHTAKDITGSPRASIQSKGIIGYINTTAETHFSLVELLNFLATLQPTGGPMLSVLNLGKSNNAFRTLTFSAGGAQDSVVGKNALVAAVNGLPTLPAGNAWSVGVQAASATSPSPIPATQAIPVVQPNAVMGGNVVPGPETHFADPADIFRLGSAPPAPVQNAYGFLQDVQTAKSFLAQPFIQNVTSGGILPQLSLRQVPSLADPGILLGAIGSFPAISSALPMNEITALASSLGQQSLAIDKWIATDANKTTSLINTSVATVDLQYRYFNGKTKVSVPSPPSPVPPVPPGDVKSPHTAGDYTVHVTLGQPGGPVFSIDIYDLELRLFIPPVDSGTPCLRFQGGFHADSQSVPTFPGLNVVYDGPLQPLTQFFSTLETIMSFVNPGGASSEVRRLSPRGIAGPRDSGGGAGLNVHFADGQLTVSDTFALPSIPLGPGTIYGISLDLSAGIDIVSLDVDFLVGIGSPDAPVHWIVDPLSGTGCLQAGVQGGQLAVLVQLGLGLGLAIDLGIASGSVSIVIAFQVQIQGSQFTLMLLLTGQAQVTVLGGLASASLTISCGLGLSFPLSLPAGASSEPVTAIGTASVGIHLSICWVISIDWTGSWSFSHTFSIPLPA